MDAGLAAIIGAVVGATASVASTLIGLVPGISPEDSRRRVERKQRSDDLLSECTSLLVDSLLFHDADEKEHARRLARMSALDVELALVLGRRDRPLIDLWVACRMTAQTSSIDLMQEANARWTVFCSSWRIGKRDTRGLQEAIGLLKLRRLATPTA